MDYGAVSTLLMFSSCETRQCTNITITNDVGLEDTESFSITLLRATDTTTLDLLVGEIEITDDDGLLDIYLLSKGYVAIKFHS